MNVVIVGANRGIGLEYCKQSKERGDQVWALCRKPSKELQDLGVNIVEGVDATDSDALINAADSLGTGSVDVLLHNAGIFRSESLADMNYETIIEQLVVNSVAPVKSVCALLPCLKSGAKIGLMTSRMGSIADNTESGGCYGYRMSKAALNAAGKSLSIDLKPKNISVALLHPGYVKTDMTQGKGAITPQESVKGLIAVMDEVSIDTTGQFWHSNGETLPW